MENNINEKNIETPNKFKTYSCPCCSNIPEILYFDEVYNNISYKCSKCNENRETIINIHSYLKSMSKILNSSKIENRNMCNAHNMPYELYCKTCELNMCYICYKENKNHLYHIKYKNTDIYPNNNEKTFLKNKINIYIEEKIKLLKKLEIINDKITFYEMILNGIKKQSNNYYKNINVKHLIYGLDINITKIFKDTENPIPEIKKLKLNEIINKKMLDSIKDKRELYLLNNNLGEDFIFSLFNNSLIDIIKENNIQILEDISCLDRKILKNLKVINLKGNKITSLNFLTNSNFPNLEFLSLNDNNITNIEPLKEMNSPLIKQLYLSKNKINSIKIFEDIKMNNLQILWLTENNISSIDSFKESNLNKLEKLGINKNKIKNINVFKYAKFPLLMELYINDNDIDFTIPETIEIIKLLENKIEDFFY